jgi:hypothetical protein
MEKLAEINIDLQMALKRMTEGSYLSARLFVMSALRNVNAAQQKDALDDGESPASSGIVQADKLSGSQADTTPAPSPVI